MTREERNAKRRALYAERKQWKVCVTCGKQDAYTLNGRARCYECAEMFREIASRRDKEKRKILEKSRRDKFKSQGLCPNCGKLPMQGRIRCAHCISINLAAHRRESLRKKVSRPFPAPVVCAWCKRPVPLMEGKTICQNCLDSIILPGAAKGRESQKLNGTGFYGTNKGFRELIFNKVRSND